MISDVVQSVTLTRRRLLAGATVLLAVTAAPALAAGTGTTRAASWAIGSNLGFAGMLYAQGAAAEMVDNYFGKAQSIASSSEIGIDIRPLPAKSGTMPETMADVIHYLIQGDGWAVGQALSDKFDTDHGRLFEVAVKSGLLMILYQPGDDSGIGEVLKDRCGALGLPGELWTPVTDAIDAKQDSEAVRDAVLAMHDNVLNYLLKS